MDRIATIRTKEKEYHDECYTTTELFEPGSWLHKPVKTIIDLLELFDHQTEVNVLDLGCGVGRNCIPIAQRFLHKDGKISGVDILESAIHGLKDNSKKFNVNDKIIPVLSDISEYRIPIDFFDLIFSVSSLEHLDSESTLNQVIEGVAAGTKRHGVNCYIINTNIKETEIVTGKRTDPMFELILDSNFLKDKLERIYKDWVLIKHTVKPYATEIIRDGKRILLESAVLTWVVQKPFE